MTQSVLKRLKEHQLETLLTAVESKGDEDTECVVLPWGSDLHMGKHALRFSGASGGGACPLLPHVFSCMVWRWPDLRPVAGDACGGTSCDGGMTSCDGGMTSCDAGMTSCEPDDVTLRSTESCSLDTVSSTVSPDFGPRDGLGVATPFPRHAPSWQESHPRFTFDLNERDNCVPHQKCQRQCQHQQQCQRECQHQQQCQRVCRQPPSPSYLLRQLPVCRTRSSNDHCINPYHWACLFLPGNEVLMTMTFILPAKHKLGILSLRRFAGLLFGGCHDYAASQWIVIKGPLR
jgi:hypothetical protein